MRRRTEIMMQLARNKEWKLLSGEIRKADSRPSKKSEAEEFQDPPSGFNEYFNATSTWKCSIIISIVNKPRPK